jgi:hypothetical protein
MFADFGSAYDEDSHKTNRIDAFRSGAKGVFTKFHTEINTLVKCVRRVLEGQIWVNNNQLVSLLDAFKGKNQESPAPPAPRSLLTPREQSIVRLAVEVLSRAAASSNQTPSSSRNHLAWPSWPTKCAKPSLSGDGAPRPGPTRQSGDRSAVVRVRSS